MRIALVAPTGRSVWAFRKGLINELLKRGHKVDVLCPKDEFVNNILSLGVHHKAINLSRFFDPIGDAAYIFNLFRLLSKEKYDIVHCFTSKPNIYGSIAGRLCGIAKIVGLVEGLGFYFSDELGVKGKMLRKIITFLYWISFRIMDRVWFVNLDDIKDLRNAGVLPIGKELYIKSIGVNREEYKVPKNKREEIKRQLCVELNEVHSCKFVTMVSRMIWPKGIREFVDSAREVLNDFPDVRFLIIGEIQEGSPYSVPKSYLDNIKDKRIRWLGFRTDVVDILSASDIFVLPTYYREGVPRVLLEAMSVGLPIVATDSVGCREVVKHGENGLLVPVRDSVSLANAIKVLLRDEGLSSTFGKNSKKIVAKELDERIIVDRVIKELYCI